MILVKWTYTHDEWQTFLRASKKKKNLLYRLIHRFMTRSLKYIPMVKITPEKVWIGSDQQYFNSALHELRQIDLRNEGSVNVLAITYAKKGCNNEIRVPVPKGKLREAIQLQERLHEQSLPAV